MRLASASKVLLTMGIVENPGSLTNASHALDVSFSIVENLLETTLTQEHRTDYFDVIDGELCYRLTNMLVDSQTVVVRRSINGDQLLTPDDGELVSSSEYMLDAARGLVTFRTQQTEGYAQISIAYDSGLPTSDDDEEVLDAPQWLQECAVATAVHVLNTFPSSPANRKDKTVVNVSAEIRHAASQLLNSRKRPRMTVTFPSLSELDG